MIKKLSSLALALVMCLSLCVPAFAASRVVPATEPIHITTDDELIQSMQALGLSDTEIGYILQLEHTRVASPSGNPSLWGFPSNPKVGDVHYETIDVHFTTVGVTTAGILAALIGGGVAAGVAMAIANGVLNEVLEDADATGVWVKIKYIYGTTNDGVPGWIYGPATYGLLYD